MEIKRIGGLSAVIAGASLAVGALACMYNSSNKIDKLERQGYNRSDAEYIEMEKSNKNGQLALVGGALITAAGAVLLNSKKKKKFICEAYNSSNHPINHPSNPSCRRSAD